MSEYLEQAKEIVEANHFVNYNHIVIADVQEDFAKAYLDIVKESTNMYDAVHGGVYCTMADTCGGFAARTDGRRYVTLSANVSFIRGASKGRITGTGKVIHRGRTNCIVEIRITDEEERLLSLCTFTYHCIS